MYATSPRQRTASALASLAIVGLGGAALVLGLSSSAPLVRKVQETLVALTPAREEPPRPRPTPPPKPTRKQSDKAQSARMKGAPSPANLRNRATAVFAPVLPPLRTPPPIVAAPRPADGAASNTGNANRIGPGQGAGGVGDGTGAGGNGDGDGNGYDEATTRPVQTRGRLRWSDLPPDLRARRNGSELELTYRVNVDGRVSNCRVTQSSGYPGLDARTCQLITERFRFRPSRDAAGRAVPAYIVEVHGWDPPPEDTITD